MIKLEINFVTKKFFKNIFSKIPPKCGLTPLSNNYLKKTANT